MSVSRGRTLIGLDLHEKALDVVIQNEVLAGDPVVRRYETRFIKKRRKYSTALPIESDV